MSEYVPRTYMQTEPAKAIILHIFDPDFVRQGMVTNYITLDWTEDYYGVGSFMLVCVDSTENIKLLQQGWYVAQKGLDTAMVIRYVKYDTQAHQIIIRGHTTLTLLAQRTVFGTKKVSNVETGMRQIVSENLRGLPNQYVAASQGLTDVFETQFTDEYVTDACAVLGAESQIGFKNVFDYRNKRHVFTTYKGTNYSYGNPDGNPPRVFSAEFKNLENMIIIDDMSIFKNVASVAGAGEDPDRVRIWVGDATGLDRFELPVDARDLQPEDGETKDSPSYLQRLRARGIQKLNDHIRGKSFSGEVSQVGFGTDFYLGDVISCKSEKYGIRLDTRILRYSKVREANITKLKLTMGDPQITLLQVVNL